MREDGVQIPLGRVTHAQYVHVVADVAFVVSRVSCVLLLELLQLLLELCYLMVLSFDLLQKYCVLGGDFCKLGFFS